MKQQLPLPPVIRIEPASACNLKCSHCPTGILPLARAIMKPSLFERVLDEVAKHIPPIRVAVLYHGGEPFLNKRFLSMARRVKDLGIAHVKTVSNGMLIKPEMCEDIVASGLDAIELSLDGESAEENDLIRINCKFDYVRSIIHRLVAANQRQGRPLKITIASTQFQTIADYIPGRAAPAPAFLRQAFAEIADEIEFKTFWGRQWPSQAPSSGYDILWDDSAREPVTACARNAETFSIRANGDVVPCCFDLTDMMVMGNVKEQSLAEIWNGPEFEAFRTNFAAARYPKLCQGCVVVTGEQFLLRKDAGDGGGQRVVPISSLGRRAVAE